MVVHLTPAQLAELAREAGVPPAEMARILRRSPGTVCNWENGAKDMADARQVEYLKNLLASFPNRALANAVWLRILFASSADATSAPTGA